MPTSYAWIKISFKWAFFYAFMLFLLHSFVFAKHGGHLHTSSRLYKINVHYKSPCASYVENYYS